MACYLNFALKLNVQNEKIQYSQIKFEENPLSITSTEFLSIITPMLNQFHSSYIKSDEIENNLNIIKLPVRLKYIKINQLNKTVVENILARSIDYIKSIITNQSLENNIIKILDPEYSGFIAFIKEFTEFRIFLSNYYNNKNKIIKAGFITCIED